MPARLSTEHPRWSPDAKALLFCTGTARIYVLEVPSGRARFLTHGHDPEWSPDGRQVAFVRPGTGWVLGLIQADGTGETTVAHVPDGLRGRLAWDPLGHALYLVDRAGQALSVDTRDGKIGPAGIAGPVDQLLCSPDGEWLAYVTRTSPDGVPGGVHLCHRRSGDLTAVAVAPTTKLCWTQKGRVLLALDIPGGEYVRFDMATGCARHLRASDGLLPLAPSPTTDELLHATDHAPGDLLLGETGGSRLRAFAHGFLPAWSPDGEWVAFFDGEDEEASLCTQSRSGANFTRWSGSAPGAPLPERLVDLGAWGAARTLFPGVPALAASAATYAFLPGTGAWRVPLLLAAWTLCVVLYRAGARWTRRTGKTFECECASYLLAVAPAGVLAAVSTVVALSLSAYWLVPLTAFWLGTCAFTATALTRTRAGSRRAIAAAWAIALLATSGSSAIHSRRRAAALGDGAAASVVQVGPSVPTRQGRR